MGEHKVKICQRCKADFICKVTTIELCQCSIVEIPDLARQYINENYQDCLCASCLKVIAATNYDTLKTT